MELVLVRHAESIWNRENRWQGKTDVPLTDQGRAEARKLGERLRGVRFDRAFSSDLSRARETAEAIAHPSLELDPELREMDLGAWEGLFHHEVVARFPQELRALAKGGDDPIGGGESMLALGRRAMGVMQRIVDTGREGERVLVVTHGGVIRSIVMRVLGLPGGRPLVGVGNTAISLLRVRGGELRLAAYNCASHLETAPLDRSSLPIDEEVLEGESDVVVRLTLAHLGLDPASSAAIDPPAPTTRTHLLHGENPQLRAFAVPHVRFP